MRKLLSGNEAIARGAWEAGVTFAAGYPGTPSTEILENLARYPEVDAQWSANEKVAFDEGMGAAIGGLRVLVTMKHVGLNVAADSFMVFPYAGTNGGFVVISADDPGMHSSQNEQDNRYLALIAKVPLLEPADAQECKDFTQFAFELSEQFGTPVMLRTTTRSAHTKGPVTLGERREVPRRDFTPDIRRYSVPIYRHLLRPRLEARLRQLAEYAETCPLNVELREDKGTREQGRGIPPSPSLPHKGGGSFSLAPLPPRSPAVGVIASGIAYQYAREVWPEADFFKLGLVYPLPAQRLLDFCQRHETVYVVEEGEAFIENQLRALGADNLIGKELFGVIGEYSPQRLAAAAHGHTFPTPFADEIAILPRPPMFCVGCGHRTVFDVLRQLKVLVAGDIGCYTMGALPPYEASHTTFCMGASIGNAFGFLRAGYERTVAVIGDSTFIHAGIPSLVDTVYNGGKTTVIILDNGTTGMTGQQPHPAAGQTLKGAAAPKLDLEALCRAIGVQHVTVVDTWQRSSLLRAIRAALAYDGPAVVIARGPCQQLPEMRYRDFVPYAIDEATCTNCEACYKVWCPAIAPGPNGKPAIDALACVACGLCAQVCVPGAIRPGASLT